VIGALAIYITRVTRGRAAQFALDRAVDHDRHLCGVADPGLAFRRRNPDFQFVEKTNWLAAASPTTWVSTAFRCHS